MSREKKAICVHTHLAHLLCIYYTWPGAGGGFCFSRISSLVWFWAMQCYCLCYSTVAIFIVMPNIWRIPFDWNIVCVFASWSCTLFWFCMLCACMFILWAHCWKSLKPFSLENIVLTTVQCTHYTHIQIFDWKFRLSARARPLFLSVCIHLFKV